MGKVAKIILLSLVITFALSSLIMHESASAQSSSKPSVPEFTLKYVDNSFDVPPTYGIDQYTGKNVTIQSGYHVQNKSIELSIKNQPFTNLFYNISSKGHYASNWTYHYYNKAFYNQFGAIQYFEASNSPYTILVFGFNGNNGSTYYVGSVDDVPTCGQIDFQVQAYEGYATTVHVTPSILFGSGDHSSEQEALTIVQWSDWSSTQTITIPETVSSSTPTPTSTVPEFSWLIILTLITSMIIIALATKRKSHYNS